MAELADAHGLGPCAERRAGSSPVPGTSAPRHSLLREVPRPRSGFRRQAPACRSAQVQVLFPAPVLPATVCYERSLGCARDFAGRLPLRSRLLSGSSSSPVPGTEFARRKFDPEPRQLESRLRIYSQLWVNSVRWPDFPPAFAARCDTGASAGCDNLAYPRTSQTSAGGSWRCRR
jgi:hypothetical protein